MQQIINELCPELVKTKTGAPLHSHRLPFLRNVITVGFRQHGAISWDEATGTRQGRAGGGGSPSGGSGLDTHDVCNMQYTSGTTGFPKGVMLTHYNVVNNGKCIGDRMDLSTADRMMIQVPMFHCFGMVLAMTAAMTHGAYHLSAALLLARSRRWRASTRSTSPASTACPPCSSPCWSIRTLKRPTSPTCARASWPARPAPSPSHAGRGQQDAHDGDHHRLRPDRVVPRLHHVSSTDDPLEVRVGTVGRALPEIECNIVDPETDEEMPDGVDRRVRRPRLQHHEGLLQNARRDPRRHR